MTDLHGKTKRFFHNIPSLDGWALIKVKNEAGRCICGTKIQYRYIYANGNRIITLGQQCAERLGDSNLAHNTPKDYLCLAERLAVSQIEKDIVKTIQAKLAKYKSNVKISQKQAKVLEKIVGFKWGWQIWN